MTIDTQTVRSDYFTMRYLKSCIFGKALSANCVKKK